ncbi:hypothetical protein ACJX0J_008094, partial [Zea mays]
FLFEMIVVHIVLGTFLMELVTFGYDNLEASLEDGDPNLASTSREEMKNIDKMALAVLHLALANNVSLEEIGNSLFRQVTLKPDPLCHVWRVIHVRARMKFVATIARNWAILIGVYGDLLIVSADGSSVGQFSCLMALSALDRKGYKFVTQKYQIKIGAHVRAGKVWVYILNSGTYEHDTCAFLGYGDGVKGYCMWCLSEEMVKFESTTSIGGLMLREVRMYMLLYMYMRSLTGYAVKEAICKLIVLSFCFHERTKHIDVFVCYEDWHKSNPTDMLTKFVAAVFLEKLLPMSIYVVVVLRL